MITTELFTWDKATRTLVAMASDGELHDWFRPGYGAPMMLQVKSSHTGRVVEFHYHTMRQTDGDIMWWDYTNKETNITLRVFND